MAFGCVFKNVKILFLQTVAVCLVISTLTKAEITSVVFFSAVSSLSHRQTMFPLAEALSDKGYGVTYISPHQPATPHSKIVEYVPRVLNEMMLKVFKTNKIYTERKNNQLASSTTYVTKFGLEMCEALYKDKDFIYWFKSTKVDLVILDSLSNECAYGMVHYWNAKVILYHTYSEMPYFSEVYGLPIETSWLPALDLYYPPGPAMTFIQRIQNNFWPIYSYHYRNWFYFPKLEHLTRESLGVMDLPKFEEIEKNKTYLIFLNVHFSMEYPRSLPPNTIAVGGTGISGERYPLPKDLAAFVGRGHGFILVSFGSWTDLNMMDKSVKEAFVGTMNNLSHIQFVFKVKDQSLIHEFKHGNVFVADWVPQQDLLAHPKIRGFVTQAGLISLQEAVYHAVPLICFPFHSEQDYNAEIVHRKGFGINMEITTITQPQLEHSIGLILNDSKYKINANEVSIMFRDRPNEPLEVAVWWTEFVLRHSHNQLITMRPHGFDQPFWKTRGIDVWATVISIACAVFTISVYCIWFILSTLYQMSGWNKVGKVSVRQYSKKQKKLL